MCMEDVVFFLCQGEAFSLGVMGTPAESTFEQKHPTAQMRRESIFIFYSCLYDGMVSFLYGETQRYFHIFDRVRYSLVPGGIAA